MTLQELFQRLSYGPFSTVAIGNDGAGTILDAKKPAVVLFANDALLRLHTRFDIHESSVTINQVDAQTLYEIGVGKPYIQGTFDDDLIKILRAYDVNGLEIPLNNEWAIGSYFTPQNHILQVPFPIQDQVTTLVYQARHPRLKFEPEDLTQVITLPPTLEEAMVAYIAYLHFSSMNGQENVARAAEYFNRYNAICNEVESRGVVNTSDSPDNCKLEQRGFV